MHVHFALAQVILPEDDGDHIDVATRALISSVRDHWMLGWQETLAECFLWLGREEGIETAEVVRELRSREYHAITPSVRLLALHLLCERAVQTKCVRDAVDRRAEWSLAQGWSWEAASVLGRVQQHFRLSQLTRCEPLGRDRNGRLYLLHQGALWIFAEAECVRMDGGAPVRKLVQALARGHRADERQLHFTLSRMLSDGLFKLGASAQEGAAGEMTSPFELPLPQPRYDKVLGCAVTSMISGRTVRSIFVLDLLRHVQVSVRGIVAMSALRFDG